MSAGDRSYDDPGTTITVCDDGPLLIRGDFALVDGAHQPIDPHRGTIALCRCGRSAIKPFCDGTHKVKRAHSES